MLAATSVLASLTQGGFDTQPQTPGLEIVGPDRRAELGIATVVDTFRPVVVLGEVKSHQPIDENDIENLTWAQGLFRRQRIECFILVGTLQQAMSDGEIQILRRYCECAPRLLHDEGSAVGVTLPIVLTQRQLSVEWFAEDHPFKWSEPGRGLTSVAFASCKNNLGLHEIGIAYGGDDWTQQLQWTSVAGAPTADGE